MPALFVPFKLTYKKSLSFFDYCSGIFFSPCPLRACPVIFIAFFSFPFLFPVFVSLCFFSVRGCRACITAIHFQGVNPGAAAIHSQCVSNCVTKIHLREVNMSNSFEKPALMAIHRRLAKKGLYFEANIVMAYLRGIRTIYTKACVRFWFANHYKIWRFHV